MWCAHQRPGVRLDKYYRILGSRKLVLEYHPTGWAAQDMPSEFAKFSTKRFREIREAYDAIASGADSKDAKSKIFQFFKEDWEI